MSIVDINEARARRETQKVCSDIRELIPAVVAQMRADSESMAADLEKEKLDKYYDMRVEQIVRSMMANGYEMSDALNRVTIKVLDLSKECM